MHGYSTNVECNFHEYIIFKERSLEGWALCICDETLSSGNKEENYQDFQDEKEKDYQEDNKITKSIPLFKLLGVH